MSAGLRRGTALGVVGSALLVTVVGLLGLASPGEAAPVLRTIRHSSDASRTRIVLDLSGSATYRHLVIGDPPRVVVELPTAQAASGLASHAVGDGYVSRVRHGPLDGGGLQVVLDLERMSDYSIFALSSPARVVVDVKHGKGAPPPKPRPAGRETGPEERREPAAAPSKTPSETPREAPRNAVPKPTEVKHTPRTGPYVVAIDAGHGGEDSGAHYHGTSEKDVTLDLARALAAELETRPGVKPVLVRKGDYFIPLRKRWDLAERLEADLFVSLHCNANQDYSARGTEVYFLSLKGASDASAREVAKRENEVDERMGVVTDDVLATIVSDMIQTDVLVKSEHLAEACLKSMIGLGTVYERGVKQAGFEVLKSPRMPSVLVEAAFISNKSENKLLRDGDWQERFGKRLADGIDAFLRDVSRAE